MYVSVIGEDMWLSSQIYYFAYIVQGPVFHPQNQGGKEASKI